MFASPEEENCRLNSPANELPKLKFGNEDVSPFASFAFNGPEKETPVKKEPADVSGSFLTQLGKIREDFPAFLQEVQKTSGDVAVITPFPFTRLITISDPELIHRVLVTEADSFSKSKTTSKLIGKFLGQGVLLAENEEHRNQRQMLQPAFTAAQIEQYVPLMEEATREWVQKRTEGEVLDIQEGFKTLTLSIVARTLFGTALPISEEELIRIMHTFEQAISGRFKSIPVPEWIPTQRNREQRRAIDEMDSCIKEIMEAKRSTLIPGITPSNLLERLLARQQIAGKQALSDRLIEDQMKTFFFAGHETIARMLTWSVAMLSENKAWAAQVKKELRAENNSVFPVTEAFLKEVLRLYPPAWVFDRSATKDVTLNGVSIKRGSTLYISPYVVHRDERWFEDAETFRPERFIKDSGLDNWPRKAYLPFGGGARTCIGAAFAMSETKVVLKTIFDSLEIERVDSAPLQHNAGATLGIKGGLPVKISLRNSETCQK